MGKLVYINTYDKHKQKDDELDAYQDTNLQWLYHHDSTRGLQLANGTVFAIMCSLSRLKDVGGDLTNTATSDRIVILGGGIAGLAASLELLRRGKRVTLLEKAAVVGGLARTFVHGDFRFDIGGHRFHSRNTVVLRWLQNLMGDDLLKVPRQSHIWLQDRFVEYPIQFPNALTIFSPTQMVKMLSSYVLATLTLSRNRSKDDITFEDWVTRRFGYALYEVYFKPYTEKIWGIPCSQLSADWAAQRITLPSLAHTVRRAVYPGRNPPQTIISEFYYPRRGFGMIPERMEEEISRLGGEVVTDADIQSVEPIEGGYAVTYRRDGELKTISSHRLVSSIPLDALLRMLPQESDTERMLQDNSLKYRDIICLFLAIDKTQISTDSWTYFPQSELLFGRTHEPRNWSSEMAPDGKTSLGIEIFSSQGEPAWELSDNALAERAVREIAKIGWPGPEDVMGHWVLRVKYAYPIYDLGYADRLRELKTWLSKWKRLHLVGRTGSFRYMNSDGVIEDALALCDFITGNRSEHRDVSLGYQVD